MPLSNIKNVIFLLAVLVLTSCYKDVEDDEVVIIQDIPEVIIDHNLVGTIITDNTTLLEPVIVDYGTSTILLSDKNYFYTEAKGVNKYRQPLQITYNNTKFIYHSPYVENETNYNTFVLPSTFNSIAASSNETLLHTIGNGQISFEGGRYSKNGTPLNGNLNLTFSTIKYENKGQYPGGLIVQDNVGKLQLLAPESYFTISSEDIDSFEAIMELDDKIIYHYDLTTNVWRLVPVTSGGQFGLSKKGLYAIGGHSGYNIGYGMLINGDFGLNGELFYTKNDRLNQSYHTTNKGSFVCYIPKDESLNIELFGDCNKVINTFKINSDYQDLQEIAVNLVGYKSHVIKGQIKDCDNQPIQKSLLKISFGNEAEQVIKYIDMEDFEIQVSNCTEIAEISVESEFLNGEEKSRILAFEVNDTINLYHIHTCTNLSEEYLSLNINGVDNIMMQGEAVMVDGRVRITFTNPIDNSLISFTTSATRKEIYEDKDLNIIIDAKNMGSEGYELQCGSTNEGCGFEKFVLTEYGDAQSDFIRGYYKGRFWTKTFYPIVKAGYKNVEGVFHIRRDF